MTPQQRATSRHDRRAVWWHAPLLWLVAYPVLVGLAALTLPAGHELGPAAIAAAAWWIALSVPIIYDLPTGRRVKLPAEYRVDWRFGRRGRRATVRALIPLFLWIDVWVVAVVLDAYGVSFTDTTAPVILALNVALGILATTLAIFGRPRALLPAAIVAEGTTDITKPVPSAVAAKEQRVARRAAGRAKRAAGRGK